MLFSEVRFPEDIAYGAVGGPEFSTDVITTHNGYEQRNVNWSCARIKYNVSHGIKTNEQLSELIAFFRARKGKAYGFRFKDWTDYKANNQRIGLGDSKNTKFQLIKTYISGKVNCTRKIYKPVQNTFTIFHNKQEYLQEYSVDYCNGIVIFKQPPPHNTIISANFEFDIPARFDTDLLYASIDHSNTYNWNDISIVEVKLP